MAEVESTANARLIGQDKLKGQFEPHAVNEKSASPRWPRNIYMVCVSFILFWAGIVFLLGVGGGFPNVTTGLLLLCASVAAFPLFFDMLTGKFSLLRRKFGHPVLIFCAIAAIQVTHHLLTAIETAIDPSAGEIRNSKQAAYKRTREAAARRETVEQDQEARAVEAANLEIEKTSRRELQTSIDGLWADILRNIQPCEQAQRRLSASFAQGNFSLEAYEAAQAGRQVCFNAYQQLQSLVPPEGLPAVAVQSVEVGLKACADATLARMTFMYKAAIIIDGDRKLSNVSAAKAQAEAAEISTLQCASGIIDGAQKAGIKIS